MNFTIKSKISVNFFVILLISIITLTNCISKFYRTTKQSINITDKNSDSHNNGAEKLSMNNFNTSNRVFTPTSQNTLPNGKIQSKQTDLNCIANSLIIRKTSENRFICYNPQMAMCIKSEYSKLTFYNPFKYDSFRNKKDTFTIDIESINGKKFEPNLLLLDKDSGIIKNEISLKTVNFTLNYKNNKAGFEQSFVLSKYYIPDTGTRLSIHLHTNAYCKQNDMDTISITKNNTVVIKYHSLKVYDHDGKLLNAQFQTNNSDISINIDIKNASFPIIVDPTYSVATIDRNNTGSYFGQSTSTAGDVNNDGYSDIIVGAPNYIDASGQNTGRAFVYYGSPNGILASNFTELLSSGVNISDYDNSEFGYSVSTAGDVNSDGYSDVIVGAPSYFCSGTSYSGSYGAAFIFWGGPTGISPYPQQQFLGSSRMKSTSQATDGRLGQSVACCGDMNNDGASDCIVGSPYYTHDQTGEGAIYVFYGNNLTGLDLTNYFQYESNNISSQFCKLGFSVASAGDVNGDGYSDIIAGARHYYTSSTGTSGAVYVFNGSATKLSNTSTYSAFINGPNFRNDGRYGQAISSAGDVNGDGFSEIAFTSFDINSYAKGRVQIYNGSSAGINFSVPSLTINSPNITSSSSVPINTFGSSISCAGDINNDGHADLIVAAPFKTTNSSYNDDAGIYVYLGSSSGYQLTQIFSSGQSNSQNNGPELNQWCSSAGDVNGDGTSDLIVGFRAFDNGQIDEGIVRVITVINDNLSPDPNWSLTTSNDQECEEIIRFAGDVNGDGINDAIFLTPIASSGLNHSYAKLYYGSMTGLSNSNYTIIYPPTVNDYMHKAQYTGDINGDGYDEIYILTSDGNSMEHRIYWGSSSGIQNSNFTSITTLVTSNFIDFVNFGNFNGDGFADIILSNSEYSNGQTQEGNIQVLYGSFSGLSTTNQWNFESNIANTNLQAFTIGDFNGDGYSDLISFDQNNKYCIFNGSSANLPLNASSIFYSSYFGGAVPMFIASTSTSADFNGDGFSDLLLTNPTALNTGGGIPGALIIAHGSATGLNYTNYETIQKTITNSSSGTFAEEASIIGDINNDGYADIIAISHLLNSSVNQRLDLILGSNNNSNTTTNWIYQDNFGYCKGISPDGLGDINADGICDVGFVNITPTTLYSNYRIYYGNTIAGMQSNFRLRTQYTNLPFSPAYSNSDLSLELFNKHFLGRADAKLIWDVVPQGSGFSGNPISTYTGNSGQSTNYTNLGTSGLYLHENISIPSYYLSSKIRVRVKYSSATSITGQIYGPWHYLPGYLYGAWLKNINAQVVPNYVAKTNSTVFYNISLYPNPCSDLLYLRCANFDQHYSFKIYDTNGNKVLEGNIEHTTQIPLSSINNGAYIIRITNTAGDDLLSQNIIVMH